MGGQGVRTQERHRDAMELARGIYKSSPRRAPSFAPLIVARPCTPVHINTCSCIHMGLPDERHVCIVPQHFSYRTRGKQPWQTCVIVAHESTQVRTQVVRCSPVQPWFSRWRAHSQNHKRQPSYSAAHAPHSARAPESKCSKVLRVLYVTHSARVRSVSAVHTKRPLPCQ